MKRRLTHFSIVTVLGVALCLGFLLVATGTAQQALQYTPKIETQGGLIGSLSAQSVYVFDFISGTEIYTRNTETVLPIASVTKLVSSAMFYEHASHTKKVLIEWQDFSAEGRSGRLQLGDTYEGRELLFPALLESSNDAAKAMYRNVSIDLVETMNTYVRMHGLTKTKFADASGLSAGNVSSASELGKLLTILYAEYPYIMDVTSLKTYLNHINAWMNNNPFINDTGYVGGKHGFTYEANRTAVVVFEEVLRSGSVRRVGYVVLGSDDLSADVATLRTYVHQNFDYK